MKTAELSGAALDWAVASIELTGHDDYTNVLMVTVGDDNDWKYNPSTDWSQAGPIIEREGMDLNPHGVDSSNGRTHWRASIQWLDQADFEAIAQTPLIAAMRCYVASKLGDEVEVPDDLLSCAHE